MASHQETKLNKLSLIALDQKKGLPLARVLFYAEVGVRSTLELPPVPLDDRFSEDIRGALSTNDNECMDSESCGEAVIAVLLAGISRLLSEEARNDLAMDNASRREFLSNVILRTRDARNGETLLGLDNDLFEPLLDDAIRAEAEERGLALEAPLALTPIAWAHPMGILATDHAGYLSYDLTRLPDSVSHELQKAIEVRQRNPEAILDTTIWVYPMAREELRFDALAQGRFAHDAILLKLQLNEFELPDTTINFEYLSMQNPDLTDWRISPASFAANPRALLGENGCETLLPANVALQEFRFYQVIRHVGNDAPQLGLPADLQGKVMAGIVHEYRLAWYPIGHSLGQVLYSLPLAPGESVNLAVIDWNRRDEAQRTDESKLDEQLVHNQRRDRTITETVRAAVGELQEGSSFMAGAAMSVGTSTAAGAAIGSVVPGIGTAIGAAVGFLGGLAASIGGSSSDSSGSRQVGSDTVQKLSDNVAQASSAMREFQSTVVVRSAQWENEAIETRTIVNYNHSHTLTILYYEVLRHFRLVSELVRRRPVVLTNIQGRIAYLVTDPDGTNRHEIYWPAIFENRKLLEAALLDDRYKEGFALLERKRHRQRIAEVQAESKPPLPPKQGDRLFNFFTFEMKTGGMFSEPMDDHGNRVEVVASLLGSDGTKTLVDPAGVNVLNQRGSFREANVVNTFVAILINGISIKWRDISSISFWINPQGGSEQKVSFQHITVTATDVGGGKEILIDQPYETGHLIVTDEGAHIILPSRLSAPDPTEPTPPALSAELIEEEAKLREFNEHLLNRRPHYERVLRLNAPPAIRAFELAGLGVGGGLSLLDKVENRPLEVIGEYVAYPCVDYEWSKLIMAAFDGDDSPDPQTSERLITLPTRGVFAEAKLGHCNTSEEIVNTRFWDWQTSPIPHFAPEIAPVQAITPQAQQPNVSPTPFPQSLVNIVNPPNAPDPTGMAAALNLLGTPNIFRDMSGRAEVAQLLGKLSDNSISAAQAASEASRIQSKYGTNLQGLGSGGGSGAGSGTSSSPRARPTEPSMANRDLHDLQHVLEGAQERGLQSPESARESYQKAVDATYPSVEQVGDTYVRPAYTPSELVAIVGEIVASDALKAKGHIVFSDWRKHVSATGFDMVSFDPAGEGSLWIVDNKAQFRGIGGANALTGPAFDSYKAQLKTFLEKTWHNKAEADLALKALQEGRVKLVVSNGFAGDAARFTKGLFDKGLHAFDVRLGKLFPPGTVGQSQWQEAYKQLTLKKGARVTGQRGAASVGAMLFVMASVGAGMYLVKAGADFKQIFGEIPATVALNVILSKLPGGLFGGFALEFESDNSYLMRARRLDEQVDALLSALPDVDSLSPAELQTTRNNLKQIIENPMVIEEPEPPAQKPKLRLPGFQWPPEPDWA